MSTSRRFTIEVLGTTVSIALMDNIMPTWRSLRDDLNRLPVKHEEWGIDNGQILTRNQYIPKNKKHDERT